MGHQTRLDEPLNLLVVSHSCLEEVNRSVYRYLHREHQIPVHLVLPSFNDVGDGFRLCGPTEQEPIHCSVLEPMGSHLRLRRLRGLSQLIQLTKPSHILVESDPASLLVAEVLWAVRATPTKVWSLTAENQIRNLNPLTRLFLQISRKRLTRVYTVSRAGTIAMERLGFEGRTSQIPLGFDPQLFFPQSPEKIKAFRDKLGLKEFTFGLFGRLSPEKGADLLIEALARLKDLRWQLLLDNFTHIQSDYLTQLKQRIREYGLKDRIVFFDATHGQIPDYMNACHVTVAPSRVWQGRGEQYGRVVPEAMACGRLVIGSTSGTIPELLADSGILFPEGNAQDLARVLRETLQFTEEKLYELGERARVRAAAVLSITAQAASFAQIMQEDEREWKMARSRDALGFLTSSPGELR